MNIHGTKLRCKEIARATRKACKESPLPNGRIKYLGIAGRKLRAELRLIREQKNPTPKKKRR